MGLMASLAFKEDADWAVYITKVSQQGSFREYNHLLGVLSAFVPGITIGLVRTGPGLDPDQWAIDDQVGVFLTSNPDAVLIFLHKDQCFLAVANRPAPDQPSALTIPSLLQDIATQFAHGPFPDWWAGTMGPNDRRMMAATEHVVTLMKGGDISASLVLQLLTLCCGVTWVTKRAGRAVDHLDAKDIIVLPPCLEWGHQAIPQDYLVQALRNYPLSTLQGLTVILPLLTHQSFAVAVLSAEGVLMTPAEALGHESIRQTAHWLRTVWGAFLRARFVGQMLGLSDSLRGMDVHTSTQPLPDLEVRVARNPSVCSTDRLRGVGMLYMTLWALKQGRRQPLDHEYVSAPPACHDSIRLTPQYVVH